VSGEVRLAWRAPGPVAAAYVADRKRIGCIQGPIGAGKTSASFIKILTLAQEQAPSTRDGVRKLWACVIHKTYRQLWRSTIKSWWKWMPQDAGKWSGGKDEPAKHEIAMALPDGTRVDLMMDFIAIGDHQVEDVLRGYEPTLFLLNEVDLLAHEVFIYTRGRAGRYPAMDEGGPSWHGLLMDCNAPVIGSWLHELATDGGIDNMSYFVQPSALSPQAENLENLVAGYYADQIQGQPAWYVERMIENRFGQRRDGKPIFPEFNDRLHVAAEPLEANDNLALIVGMDAGGTPAATFWQRMPDGQWRGLDELVTENDASMGPARFGELLAQKLKERFPKCREIKAWADPAAQYGSDGEDRSWIEIVAKKSGIRIRPAPGNNRLTERFEAERGPMTRLIDGHKPGLLISPRMKMLRRALGGQYRYRKIKLAEAERYTEEPDKNAYSHVAESSQYAKLGGGEYAEIKGRKAAGETDWKKHGRVARDAGAGPSGYQREARG
jgi:hypothetical protein